MSLTPVDADLTVGGEHDTQTAEDNMVKVQTGDTSNEEYNAGLVHQVTNMQQEYPEWIIWAFAMAMAIAVPSPLSAFSNWRSRRELKQEISFLRSQLYPTGENNG